MKIRILLIICGILFLLITINPLFNIFSLTFLLDKELVVSYGTIIGGIFSPLFSLISFFIIYYSFKEQKRFNDEQIMFNKKQTFLNRLYDDIKYLRNYVSNIKYIDSRLKEEYVDEIGEDFFIIAKKQLDKLFGIISQYNISKEEDIIGITFEIFFFGVSENTIDTLKYYLKKRLNDDVIIEKIIKDIRNIKTNYNKKIVFYGGHQGKLGHYFRQLYYIIEYIDESELFDDEYKKNIIAKSIRIKMSNYEQAILCYNSFTLMGKSWKKKCFISKYELIKNIPKSLLPFEPKKYYDFIYEYENI
jgi:hypothetical protein